MFNIRNKKTGLLLKDMGAIQNGQKLELQWTSSREEAYRIIGFCSKEEVEGWMDFQKKMGVELELVEA